MFLTQTQILLWCIALIILELNHLKWIWWTYWEYAKCGPQAQGLQLQPQVVHVPLRPARRYLKVLM